MNNKKLAQLIREQRPVPDQAFDAAIDARARQLAREEHMMKKKMPVLAICVALLLSLALFGGVAELLGLNLFELFGKQDDRLARLAPQAALREVSPVSADQGDQAPGAAAITSAYYDGQSLIVGYAVENGMSLEAFEPTKEQLSRMEKDANPPVMAISDPATEGLLQAWNDAVQAGRPFGFIQRSLSVSDHTKSHDGHDLPASSEAQQPGEGQALYTLREYQSPLPEAVRNRDMLQLEIGLSSLTSYRYFDGKDTFVLNERRELPPLKAAVWRADAQAREYAGEGSYLGHQIKAHVTASAAHAQAGLRMAGGLFPTLPEDAWYEVRLLDEHGQELRAHTDGAQNTADMDLIFDGIGRLPDSLELRLRAKSADGPALPPELQEEMAIRLEMTE